MSGRKRAGQWQGKPSECSLKSYCAILLNDRHAEAREVYLLPLQMNSETSLAHRLLWGEKATPVNRGQKHQVARMSIKPSKEGRDLTRPERCFLMTRIAGYLLPSHSWPLLAALTFLAPTEAKNMMLCWSKGSGCAITF